MSLKLSISNISWDEQDDEYLYTLLKETGFRGIEIAPTRLYPKDPYDHINDAEKFVNDLEGKFGLSICSMQSIWFGREENIFCENQVDSLIEYTKKAIEFAQVIRCENLVFGCPRNRILRKGEEQTAADYFFTTIASYAHEHNCFISLEPNPPIYNTNFINTTEEAFSFVRRLNNPGLKVNVDLGTMIYNHENVSLLENNMMYINHIHISEPYLESIEVRELHEELRCLLIKTKYDKYISIEMKNKKDLENLKSVVYYVSEVFL